MWGGGDLAALFSIKEKTARSPLGVLYNMSKEAKEVISKVT